MTNPKKKNPNNQSHAQEISSLKNQLKELRETIANLEKNNTLMEAKLEKIETEQAITKTVSNKLAIEVDRLHQYTRRSNVIIRHVPLPENESVELVEEKVREIISKELQLPNIVAEIDKAHRVGKINIQNNKKSQNIIVRFKSHSARYSVYNKRKLLKNKKIGANLTPHRSQLLQEAITVMESLEKEDGQFVFSDLHGDLKLRVKEAYDGRHYFSFSSIETLHELLSNLGLA